MSKFLLLLACVACMCHGRRVPSMSERSQSNSIAKSPFGSAQAFARLLQAAKPADAFNPSGSGLHFSSYPSRRSPVHMVELRTDVTGDGGTYTMQEFKDYYTEAGEDWEAKWNAATPAGDQRNMDDLNVGDVVQATVQRIAPFGAFCDIGVGNDALLHISQISDQFVSDIYEHVQEGQQYDMTIKEIDLNRGRIGLTMRGDGGGGRPAPNPDATPLEELQVGQTVTGKVQRIANFGAFVDIGAQKDGLLHISEITNEFISDVNEHLEIGQEVTARIKEIDMQNGRIGLSCRDEDGGDGGGGSGYNEEGTPLEELSEGQEVTGTVATIMNFGAFVDIGAQKQALLHISEITDEFISEVSEKLQVGDEVRAVIKELDIEGGKIGISSRDLER